MSDAIDYYDNDDDDDDYERWNTPLVMESPPEPVRLFPHSTLVLNGEELWGCGFVYQGPSPPVKTPIRVPMEIQGNIPDRLIYVLNRHYIIAQNGLVYETGDTVLTAQGQINDFVFYKLIRLPEPVRQIRDFACGMRTGIITCDDLGQVWMAGDFDHFVPDAARIGGFVKIPGVENIQKVSHGLRHALMLDSQGVPFSIGEIGGLHSALGRVVKTLDAAPMEGLPGDVHIVSIRAGTDCSYLLDNMREIWACGRLPTLENPPENAVRREEQLTLIKWPPAESPMRDPETRLLDVEEIYEFAGSFCARKSNGDWWIGGYDIFDQAVRRPFTNLTRALRKSRLPQLEPQFRDCKLIFHGRAHMWFATRSGEVLAWGTNRFFGLGLEADSNLVLRVAQIVPGFTYLSLNIRRIWTTKGSHKRIPGSDREGDDGEPPSKRVNFVSCTIVGCKERANYVCSGCKKAYYCSKWCRNHHWRTLKHHEECDNY